MRLEHEFVGVCSVAALKSRKRQRQSQAMLTRQNVVSTIFVATASLLIRVSGFLHPSSITKTTPVRPIGIAVSKENMPSLFAPLYASALNATISWADGIYDEATAAASAPAIATAPPADLNANIASKSSAKSPSQPKVRVVRVEKSFRRRIRQTASSNNIPTTTKTASSGANQREKRKRRIPKHLKRTPNEDEFDWLHWVYQNWKNTQPGQLNDYMLSQIAASIPRWARRKSLQAAQRAEQALGRLIQEAKARVDDKKKKQSLGDVDQLPVSEYLTVSVFNAAMDAYGKIGRPDGVQRILRRMENLRQSAGTSGCDAESHFHHLHPDEFSMSILATAWAKSRSPDSADQVEAILQFMDLKNMSVNTNVYNTVLHAIAVSPHADKALRAEDIVESMKGRPMNSNQDCYPDVYTYQSLIQAWAYTPVAGAPQRCELILRLMDEEADKAKISSLKPNNYCYTSKFFVFSS
jgi:hypothetical protein